MDSKTIEKAKDQAWDQYVRDVERKFSNAVGNPDIRQSKYEEITDEYNRVMEIENAIEDRKNYPPTNRWDRFKSAVVIAGVWIGGTWLISVFLSNLFGQPLPFRYCLAAFVVLTIVFYNAFDNSER